jgi:alanyl-tRNA synthetase
MLMAVRGFKYAGDLEDMISQFDPVNNPNHMQQMQQMQQQMQAMQKELAKYEQMEQAKVAADINLTKAKSMSEAADAQETLANAQTKKIENAANMAQFTTGGAPVMIG